MRIISKNWATSLITLGVTCTLWAVVATVTIQTWSVNLTCLASHNSAWSAALPIQWSFGFVPKKLNIFTTTTGDGRGIVTSDTLVGESGERQSGRAVSGEVSANAPAGNISFSASVQSYFENISVGATVMVDPTTKLVFAVLKSSNGSVVQQPIGVIQENGFFATSEAGFYCIDLLKTEHIGTNIPDASIHQTTSYIDAVWVPVNYTYHTTIGDSTYQISTTLYQLVYIVNRADRWQVA